MNISFLHKKQVIRKMLRYNEKIKAGEYGLQLLELNYDNMCNFKCEHCFADNFGKEQRRFDVEKVKALAEQAHELGCWQWHFQGGEPLLWKDLDALIEAVGPDRFYIFITTNGWFMTAERAQELAALGVDKVCVSLDSADAATHDAFRGMPGAHARAVEALRCIRDAGMQANVNVTISHQNAQSEDVLNIIRFAEEHDYTVYFVIATPSGAWFGNDKILITDEDREYLLALREKYAFLQRDLWPMFDFEWGCRTMNGFVYVTPQGDLLACTFIHIRIGNVLDEPLADVLKRGWRVKYFRDFNPRCLSGEDRSFIHKFMTRDAAADGLIDFNEAFGRDDLYDV
jgi:MoaA/NifB/PqqE/SkfB family radical SAM enzyme